MPPGSVVVPAERRGVRAREGQLPAVGADREPLFRPNCARGVEEPVAVGDRVALARAAAGRCRGSPSVIVIRGDEDRLGRLRRRPVSREAGAGGDGQQPAGHSHSIVAGGFEVTSSTTRLTAGISLTIREATSLDEVVGQAGPVGGHRVVGGDGADRDRVAVRARVALHADRADRGQHRERLPELAVEAGPADLLLQDRVGLAQRLEPLLR